MIFNMVQGGSGGGTPVYKYGVIRADAEKVKTLSWDTRAVADEGITLPAYNTSAQTLKASADIGTYEMDYSGYNYFILERFVCTPTYSVTSKTKGRVEYWYGSYCYEVSAVPGDAYQTQDKSKSTTTVPVTINPGGSMARLVYWSSSSALAAYASAAYGVYQSVQAPTVSSNVITLKSPVWGERGHGTYFSSTYMNALTEIREQGIIEVWRAAKGASINGWGATSQMYHMISDINSTGTLT